MFRLTGYAKRRITQFCTASGAVRVYPATLVSAVTLDIHEPLSASLNIISPQF